MRVRSIGVAVDHSNLTSLKMALPNGRTIFGGECEIRTHGGFPHHQFSRLAP